MALMEMVTRRGSFLDLGQMDQTEFRTWWRALLREPIAPTSGYFLLDVFDCMPEEGNADATAVAYAEALQGIVDACYWWVRETDGECKLAVYKWTADERRFVGGCEA